MKMIEDAIEHDPEAILEHFASEQRLEGLDPEQRCWGRPGSGAPADQRRLGLAGRRDRARRSRAG
jgi:hypothetical protein